MCARRQLVGQERKRGLWSSVYSLEDAVGELLRCTCHTGGYELHASREYSDRGNILKQPFRFFFMDAKQATSFREPILQDPGPKRQKVPARTSCLLGLPGVEEEPR